MQFAAKLALLRPGTCPALPPQLENIQVTITKTKKTSIVRLRLCNLAKTLQILQALTLILFLMQVAIRYGSVCPSSWPLQLLVCACWTPTWSTRRSTVILAKNSSSMIICVAVRSVSHGVKATRACSTTPMSTPCPMAMRIKLIPRCYSS